MFNSTLLNNNRSAYLPWKGKTFGQITNTIQKNDTIVENKKNDLFFRSPPLKIYRRETTTSEKKTNSEKRSTSIDVLNRPGSSLVVFDEKDCECAGNKHTLDINLINNRGERNICCNNDIKTRDAFDKEKIARNRARGSSIVKKTPSTVTTAPYAMSSQEYLANRGKTFKQNQFHYFQDGNQFVKPGAPGSQNNKYSVNNNGNVFCTKNPDYYKETQFKPSNYKFAQQGGVSSSARTSRLNYDTITTNGGLYTKAYGSEVGNALSYGASSDAYTIKQKIGYPAPCDTKCVTK
tara:strand:- start:7446 stop:8321 length:876 start_codon:yes stop_codon:yes gene_type:complete